MVEIHLSPLGQFFSHDSEAWKSKENTQGIQKQEKFEKESYTVKYIIKYPKIEDFLSLKIYILNNMFCDIFCVLDCI